MSARWIPLAECLGLCLAALWPHLRLAQFLARRSRAQRLLLVAMGEVLLLGVWLVVAALREEPDPRWLAFVFALVALLPGACVLGAAEVAARGKPLFRGRTAIAAVAIVVALYLLFPPADCLFLALGACDEPLVVLLGFGLSAPALACALTPLAFGSPRLGITPR